MKKKKNGDLLKFTVKHNFLSSLALMSLTPCEYKCVLVVLELGECTQAELSKRLGVARQNINKAVTRLENFKILIRTKVEGRNVYLTVNTSFQFDEFDEDQLELHI
jgi:DNA-binding MarR family transcriptional regulator